jgi:glycosyltransferase involved in cell wall biosynthesis
MPFIAGGAELLATGLRRALAEAGHQVDTIALPFRQWPPEEVMRGMEAWAAQRLTQVDSGEVERLICLKFPAYYAPHPAKVAWLTHQFRPVDDLWHQSGFQQHPAAWALRWELVTRERQHLSECRHLFTVSRTVSTRLLVSCSLPSTPLLPPAPWEGSYWWAPAEPYIFIPSRLEGHKRQHLLIEALCHTRPSLLAVVTGEGGARERLVRLVDELGLQSRVRFLGHVPLREQLALYASCLAVGFAPLGEDYGFITAEAMLSAKPVVTCSDSGGPVELVIHDETGFVADPDPVAVGAALDRLAGAPELATQMGRAGLERYRHLAIGWPDVVSQLLS